MAEDEIKKLAGSLNDLNSTLDLTDTKTLSFIRKVGDLSVSTSKSGRAWTTFSRLVSGSPIWSVQNKLRAYVDILAGFESRARQNAKAQKEANQAVIDQVQAYKSLESKLKSTLQLNDQLENLKKVTGKDHYRFLDTNLAKEGNEELKEAIKNTYAYNKAILEGATTEKEMRKAQLEGFKEIVAKGQKQKEIFEGLQKQAKQAKEFKELLSTEGGRVKLQEDIDRDKVGMGSSSGRTRRERFKETAKNIMSEEKRLSKEDFDKFRERWFTKAKWQERFSKLMEFYEKFKIKYQIFMIKFAKAARPVLNFLFKALIMSMFVFMGILLFLKFAHDIGGMLRELGVMSNLAEMFNLAINIIGAFFGLVGAFIGGDYQLAFEYLNTILNSLIFLGLRALLAGLQLLWGIASGVFYSLFDTVVRGTYLLFTSAKTQKMVGGLLLKFGLILLTAYFVKYALTQIALLIGIYALPVMMGVVILAALYGIGRWFVGLLFDKVGFLANGGEVSTPLQVVGERGPELVSLPKGSRVHSNKNSKKMLASSGGNTINITINARDTSDAELRRIADKIGNMVNNKINRRTSSRTLG